MFDDQRLRLETIDLLVTENREELDIIYNRFQVNGVCRCPLCKSLEKDTIKMKRADRKSLQYMRGILAQRPIYVFTDTAGGRRIGKVVGINNWTTWVEIMVGAKTSIIIKRHNKKHHLSHYRLGEYYNAVIHTEVGYQDSTE